MAFTVQEIQERDAALIVMTSEPPSEKWFRMWEHWFAKQAETKEDSVHRLFAYARLGAQREFEARELAKAELAEMLRSMARQVEAKTPKGPVNSGTGKIQP